MIQAQSLLMGDEVHSRNAAATLQFLAAIAAPLAASDVDRDHVRQTLAFIAANSQFFLNLSMVSSKAIMDSAHGIEASSIVTAMARNGVTTAIRVSGLGREWFQAPSDRPVGLYFPGFQESDGNPDLGDSAICETAGFGGLSIAASPALVQLVGGTVAEAIAYSREMYEITAARNPGLSLPMLDFAGAPCGIDIRKVVDNGIRPVVTTGIAHKEAGVGQIGAGIVRPPMACFAQAVLALSARLRVIAMLRALTSPRGMVTAPHHLASQSGNAVLRDGGNAVEAMVAAAATIAVVYPHMNSIGGDGFWLISRAGQAPVGIDACGRAAALATPGVVRRAGPAGDSDPRSAGRDHRRRRRVRLAGRAAAAAASCRCRACCRMRSGMRAKARRSRQPGRLRPSSRRAGAAARLRRDVPARRQRAAGRHAATLSCACPHLERLARPRSRRLLPRRDRRRPGRGAAAPGQPAAVGRPAGQRAQIVEPLIELSVASSSTCRRRRRGWPR